FLFPDRGDGTDPRRCPASGGGRLHLKASFRNRSSFIGCPNYPACKYTRGFGANAQEEEASDRELGVDPATGQAVWLKVGRYGPYVESAGDDAPRRVSLPKGWSAAEMDLERALRLLALPRQVGTHPEDGKPI